VKSNSRTRIFFSNGQVNMNDLTCPVCRELYQIPRVYACGHSVCEGCMVHMDRTTNAYSPFHLPLFRCPTCRAETTARTEQRPINHALRSLVEAHEDFEYDAAYERLRPVRPPIGWIGNLQRLASESRYRLAHDTHAALLPLLYAAACDGKRYIIVSEKPLVQRMEVCADLLSALLFEKNKIFKLVVTREEATIVFTRDAFNTQREYTNHDTNVPLLDLRAINETLESIREGLLEEGGDLLMSLSRPGTPLQEDDEESIDLDLVI